MSNEHRPQEGRAHTLTPFSYTAVTTWQRVVSEMADILPWQLGSLSACRLLPQASLVGSKPVLLGRVLPRMDKFLCGQVPTVALTVRLHDWFTEDGRVQHIDRYFKLGGDWNALVSSVARSSAMKEAAQLYAAGLKFQEIPLYAQYLRRIERGTPIRRGHVFLDSRQRVDDYFQRYVSLFQSIQERGLVYRAAFCGGASRRVGLSSWRHVWAERNEREIGIAIGREGQCYRLPGGQHRSAIAHVLKLPLLPVQIRLVHTDWLSVQPESSPWQAIQRWLKEVSVAKPPADASKNKVTGSR